MLKACSSVGRASRFLSGEPGILPTMLSGLQADVNKQGTFSNGGAFVILGGYNMGTTESAVTYSHISPHIRRILDVIQHFEV